jgi:uncharacterized tellurite resistance protein B-like protein
MNSSELVQYLANVLSIARADGTLSPTEDAALSSIAAEIGAKKKDCRDAERVAAQPDFESRPLGRYSDRVRNIEDMLFVALADGGLSGAEQARILAFAKQIGISQEQIDKIVAEADRRVKAQKGSLVCPKCAARCEGSAKFCPECGAPIQAAAQGSGTKLQFEYPSTGVAIEFAETTAATFDAALQAARASPSFQEIERGKKKWFLASWPAGTVADTLLLVSNLKGMRNRKVIVDGKETPWDQVFAFLWCAEQRNAAYRPAEFCFGGDEKRPNLWGCKQFGMDWVEWADWFSYGKYIGNDVFQFDKQRIVHELENRLHGLRFCPHIRVNLIQAVVSFFPERVRVSDRDGWKYKENYQETPDSIKVVRKENYGGVTSAHEFYSDGVAPVGFEVAKAILKKAFAQCAVQDLDVKAVLP